MTDMSPTEAKVYKNVKKDEIMADRNKVVNELKKVIVYFWLLPFTFSVFLWPGSLLKMSIIKSYGLYIYKIFFVKEEWNSVFDYERFSPIVLLLLVYFALLVLGLVLAKKLNLFDEPSSRKHQKEPIPRVGGLSIYFAFFIVFLTKNV